MIQPFRFRIFSVSKSAGGEAEFSHARDKILNECHCLSVMQKQTKRMLQ